MPPEVSVVVATHNRRGQLAALLESLQGQALDRDRFEVIVVDDASSDGTAELLAGEPGVRVVSRDTAGGPAAARNSGWREARAPLVAFTDDDCRVTPGWVDAVLTAHREHPGAFFQGPVAPDPDDPPPSGPLTRTIRVEQLGPYFQTANVAYPRELLEKLDGFDESLERGEDTDLAWRAMEAGVDPVWVPDALVYHAVNEIGFDGLLRLAIKWAPSMEIYIRHPQLREQVFDHRFFWKPNHYMLFRALVALALPKRLRSFALLLAWPYLMYLLKPGRLDGGGPMSAPIVVLYETVEMAAVGAYAAKRGRLML